MRTTLDIDQGLIKLAKAQAINEGVNLTKIIEKALRNYLPKEVKVKWVERPLTD
jgi:hypothetical protein